MRVIKAALLGIGVLALLSGLLWSAQGAGYFPYPASSFMLDQSIWVYRGLGTAAGGVVLMAVSRLLSGDGCNRRSPATA